MQKWTFQGQDIYYQKEGTGDPLLFLHNAGASHQIWKDQVSAFAEQFTCYAIDLPGYGKSAGTESFLSLAFYTQCLEQFIFQHGLNRVTLVGNCLGSAISLNYAMADPHQVERLILFHVLTPTAVKEGLFKLIFHGTERFKSSRHFLGKALSRLTLPRSVSRWVVHSQLGGLQRQSFGPLESWMEPLQQAGVLKSLGDLLVDIDSFDGLDQVKFSERLPKTWVIWGSENRILPLHSGRAFCKRARPVRFEVISGGGHWVMLERPVEVNAILRECLVDEESQVSWSSSRRSDSGSSTHARIVSRLD